MASLKKLNTFNRISGTRMFTRTDVAGKGETIIHSEGGRAGIGSTAVVNTNATFFLSGVKNMRDEIKGRYVFSGRGGNGGGVPGNTGGGGGGGGAVYNCGCFSNFPGHGWCLDGACSACNCSQVCFTASPTLHIKISSGGEGCPGNPQSGGHISGGGSGGGAGSNSAPACNFNPLFSQTCTRGGACAGGGGGVHYNPQPRPGGNGGGGGCGSMRIYTNHSLGTANPYYCQVGHGAGGQGRSPGNPGNPFPRTSCGGMFYFESPGRAPNQVNNTTETD